MEYLPDLPLLLTYIAAVVVLAITPGPDLTFFVGKTINLNVWHGLAALFGAVVGIFVHSLFVAFGLSALIVASPFLFGMIKILGAFYLLWLAIDALRNGSSFKLKQQQEKTVSLWQTWLQGLAINLLNPKIIIFFMTFLPQFVSVGDPDASGKLLVLGVLFVLISLPVIVPTIFVAGQLAGWLNNNPRITRVIDWMFAGVFGAFAVKILLTERG